MLAAVADQFTVIRSHFGGNNMVEGFWIVQYQGIQGNAGGVVLFLNGHVLGGDSGYIYTGTYKTTGNTLSARVVVRNFAPEIPNVLGKQGEVELMLQGTVGTQVIKASASLINEQGAGLVAKLTKVSNLPA
jgi:hypothetical protein